MRTRLNSIMNIFHRPWLSEFMLRLKTGALRNRQLFSSKRWKHILYRYIIPAVVFVAVWRFLVFGLPLIQELTLGSFRPSYSDTSSVNQQEKDAALKATSVAIKSLKAKYLAFAPRSAYIVINTTLNEFRLFKGNSLIREGKCSTGSYIHLEGENNQRWLFKTPKGKFHIQGKTTNPVWRKPDWAFIEEGLTPPSQSHYTRYEKGVLGDYALSLGNGYLIHGTLYKRYLGLPVTHGCVRLNDDDLKLVYQTLQTGSRVYIY